MKDFTQMNELASWALRVSQKNSSVDVTIHSNNEGMVIIVTIGEKSFTISQTEFSICKSNNEIRTCRMWFKMKVVGELPY